MKRIAIITMVVLITALALAGCSPSGNASADGNTGSQPPSETQKSTVPESTEPSASESTEPAANAGSDFDTNNDISVMSREDGSGTRGAFIELFGVEQKDESGEKVDYTTDEASITNSTSVMMTSVAGDPYAIGYISLGSLNDTVKALKIDSAEANVDNIKSESYTIARPFNIATKDGLSEAAQDFVDYILSSDGQGIVEKNSYIAAVEGAQAYSSSGITGKIVVAGSSSVTPVMEKLIEAYKVINADVDIELQQSDSSVGVQSAIDGICDIGMASRELKDSETEAGVAATKIAIDGIAVIVNTGNPMDDLSSEQVKSIYTGETLSWSEVQ